ncbi:MAG TPA: tetratricopeptide repeat protein, partial [Thermoanaerobaculia bacterium]|nr:tetratricopeptide repeat protein [Thermoanaerobaculia bacterium]
LAPQGLVVEAEEDLPLLRGLLKILPRRLARLDPRPGALTGDGVTPDRLAALARAAATFMTASGWRHLNEDDLIRIEAPETETGLGFFSLSHKGGRSAPSLIFFPDAQAFESTCFLEDDPDDLDEDPGLFDPGESTLLDAGEEDLDAAEEWEEEDEEEWEWEEDEDEREWVVELLSPSAAPADDVELWQEHGLPWAGERLLPVATLRTDRAVLRPDRRQLAFFEGLLTALAATSEEELDTGRWEKRVSTAEGEARFVLSLPGILEPDEEPLPLEPSGPEGSPQSRAEDLLERAGRALGRRGVHLARQALEVWPDCADAYNFLAGRVPDREAAAQLYELGMAAGERALGTETFEEEAGYFWGILETRPYMRARAGLAKVLVEQKRLGEAVEHYQEMLRLNPNDNQGVRDVLVNLLIELGRDEEAWTLVESYPEDGALLAFPRALLSFRRHGDSPEVRQALKKAVQLNLFVPGILLGELDPPLRGDLYVSSGESEAGLYLVLARHTWADTEGALDWLRKRTAPSPRPPKKGKRKGKKRERRG